MAALERVEAEEKLRSEFLDVVKEGRSMRYAFDKSVASMRVWGRDDSSKGKRM